MMKTKIEKTVYLFSFILLFCLVSSNLAKAQEPVGWWKLDDGTGKTAIDSSGNNHNGTVEGDGKWVEGKIGGAMQFNGSDTYISASRLPLDNQSFTITIWIYPIELKGNHTFISQGRAAANNKVHIRVGGPDAEYETPVNGLRFGFYENDLDTSANIIQTNMWYHVACIYDYEKKVRTIYVDGERVAQDTDVSPLNGQMGDLMLGTIRMNNNLTEYFNGILDDVRIYDRILTKEEIQNIASSAADSQYQGMFDTIKEAKKLIKEQKSKQAVSLLQKEISKYAQFKQKNPDKNMSGYDLLVCKLHYLHGQASEASGGKKNVIAEDYKKAINVDIISDENIQGTSLLWLFQNAKTDYDNVINSLLDRNSNYLKEVIAKSESLISDRQAKAAIDYLEGNIASYTQWQKEHSFDEVDAENILPKVYFQLAKAKEAAKYPIKDIAGAFSSTFLPSDYSYLQERTDALIWLLENNRTDELTQVVKSFTQEQNIKDIVSEAYKHFESEKDVKGFQDLLDALFTTAGNPADWATFVESCITDKTSRWAKVYYSSLEGKPRLQLGVDCKQAEQLVSDEKYKEAADLYEDILTRCGPDDDKGELEFSLIKCLFDGGFDNEAIAKIEDFTSGSYRGTHRNRVKEATLIMGRALIQTEEIDKAVDVYSSIMVEDPDTKDLPEITFYIGYCYMLQGKLEKAKEAFEIVIKSYPDSTYANQAKLSLARIKDMSND